MIFIFKTQIISNFFTDLEVKLSSLLASKTILSDIISVRVIRK